MSRVEEESFWSRVLVGNGEDCWLWQGKLAGNGYGQLSTGDRGFGRAAHRYSWMLVNGTIPEGMHICHACDVRACVRPDHLFLGTHQDNMTDMVKKGRSTLGDRNGSRKHPESYPRGESCYQTILSSEDVRQIRKRRAAGEKGIHLASEYGVSPAYLSMVYTGVKRGDVI